MAQRQTISENPRILRPRKVQTFTHTGVYRFFYIYHILYILRFYIYAAHSIKQRQQWPVHVRPVKFQLHFMDA